MTQSETQWKSPLATLPGAVALEDVEGDVACGVTAHYGDPSGEQWALEAGRAITDRPDLAVVEVSGPDRLTWLTSISSQVLTGIAPGESRELLIMNPQGHIEHACGAIDDGEILYLITEASDAQALAD